MYRKFLIVASKKDKAGINITTQLSQFRKNPLVSVLQKDEKGFDFYLVEDEILYNKNLNMEKINRYDFIIFASRHSSGKREKAITIHTPGNPKEAKYGGEPGKISKTSALFLKQLFEKLNENAEKHMLKDYDITMEATHHGPLIENKPCLFIEIGSSEHEYSDRRIGFIVAKTLSDVIDSFRENPYNEIAVALGGNHYCPNFNKIQEKSNVAISHVIPSYIEITEEMIKEAVEKTEEEIDFVILDWKGFKNAEERDKVVKILEKNYIQWKKTSEIRK